MKRRVAFYRGILFALAFLGVAMGPAQSAGTTAAVDPRAWPAAYEATPLTLAELRASIHTAQGNTTQRSSATYAERGGGLDGVEHDRYSGSDFRVDVRSGPFETSYGRYHGQGWELGANGYTLLKRGLHQRSEVNQRALEQVDPGDAVALLGRLRAPVDTYVIRVSPKDGRNELRFYDAHTFALIRREVAYPDHLSVTTYSDFRTVHGTTLAFHIVTSDGHPENDFESTLGDVAFGESIPDDALAIPPGRRLPVEFPAGVDIVRLPAHITRRGNIIVRLTIAGRGLDFELDSGCSTIFMDGDVAKSLGLPIYGKWKETVAGSFLGGRTIVPELKIGTIAMRNIAIDTGPLQWQSAGDEKVVGLLGFDFIAGGIIKIDYEHGTVDAMRYDTPLPKDAVVGDVVLDDAVPIVPAAVNGALGRHFILDTGADGVLLFSDFVGRNHGALNIRADASGKPLVMYDTDASGVGGSLMTQPFTADTIQLGPYAFHKFPTRFMSGGQPSFEHEDTDGLIGAPLLSAFDLYLDYANSRIGLVLNASGKRGYPARGGN